MKIRHFVVIAALSLLSACNLGNATGYVPTSAEIAELRAGSDTKDSVGEAFGPPAFIGERGDKWYYVASQRRYPGFFPTQEVERRVLVLSFAGNRLQNIQEEGLTEGSEIAMSRVVTETGGRKLTLWEQLRGAAGNFSAERFLADTLAQ